MSIESDADFAGLKEVGRIVRLALDEMARSVRVGTTTFELAKIGGTVIGQNGARSAPALVYGFPDDVLISVNEEAVHGIPSPPERCNPGI